MTRKMKKMVNPRSKTATAVAEAEEWLNVDQAAERLGVCRETVRRHVRKGLISKDKVRHEPTIGYPLSIRADEISRLKREGVVSA